MPVASHAACPPSRPRNRPVPDWQLDTYEVLAVAAAAAAGLCLLLLIVVLARLRVLSRRVRRMAANRGGGDPAVAGRDGCGPG